MQYPQNRRVLIVDDTPSIHEDFRKILAPDLHAPLEAAESVLFGSGPRAEWSFALSSAYQGAEALALVEASVSAGQPYAVAFVDMRMPPGWDGMETVERLWQADPQLQVVICTAYSDHPWHDLLERLDVQDRLVILKKPFDLIEVSQLARTLSTKWSLARQVERRAQEQELEVEHLRIAEGTLRDRGEDLKTFARAVSHDLRSPLALISSFCHLLQKELDAGTPAARKYLEHIQNHAALGQELVAGLLTLTRIDRAELHLERVEIGRLVAEHAAELRQAAPHRDVSIEVEAGIAVSGDPRLVRIAVRNLLENAWKFTGRRAAARIEIGVTLGPDGCEVLSVRDNGCGFDMAQADRLFRTFQRLLHEHDYPGTGVGLVTVERVAARHGGRAWCTSIPGAGSTFFLSFPSGPVASTPAH
ncbi:sensor histidine kinase [Ramlibacter pallidus]|uniref:histidine kinase n=1 Tax=Ramlibacter pallidus TaxID=2780087 RepID=A0ABR9S3S0_9BURK|nr:ATP-binding protein [Ramlibacter pallidus]MBE7368156.1 response regulator [Ramlibacter pallidus]